MRINKGSVAQYKVADLISNQDQHLSLFLHKYGKAETLARYCFVPFSLEPPLQHAKHSTSVSLCWFLPKFLPES